MRCSTEVSCLTEALHVTEESQQHFADRDAHMLAQRFKVRLGVWLQQLEHSDGRRA